MILLINLLWTFTIVVSANIYPDEKCPYRSTVDLTNQRNYDNGFYIYQGILIPPEKQSLYDYHLLFGNEKVSVPIHLRGCVCDERNPCIKLCCAKNEFFSPDTYKCEKLSKNFKVSWDLKIQLPNNRYQIVNIFQKFIHQVGLPCDFPEPLIMDTDKWILLENGTIATESEPLLLDTMSYCLTPQRSYQSDEYLLTPLSCAVDNGAPWNQTINAYAMAVSVLFLISTIMVYMFLKELRGNLRGKILICYWLSLGMAYGIISFINIPRLNFQSMTCNLIGYTCYFFFMAAFLWLSVLCYDIWDNFVRGNVILSSNENIKRFIYYSLHAWGWSTLFTLLCLWADLSPIIGEIYKPGVGITMCWINTTSWSAAIYFYGPNSIILIFNFITFAYLTTHIYIVRRDSASIMSKDQCFQVNAIVILRLFLIMGVSWIFDILSYCLPHTDGWQLWFTLFDFVNALQGPLIFTLFVLKRNVLNLLKKRFMKSSMSFSPNTGNLQSSTTCNRF